ncbi:MAG: molecular chaperone [Porticoccaceae bacterium]|nr:molecular chaperone [Porticoccaceae bacterium]
MACLYLVLAAQVHGASLSVAPTLLEFGPGETAKALTLRNSGSEVLQAQIRVYSWYQEQGKDVLEPTAEVVASPPFISLSPGSRQLVRVVYRGSADQSGEQSYRLLVDELPATANLETSTGTDTKGQSGLNFLLRFSLPVFITPTAVLGPPELQWQLDSGNGHHGSLVAVNRGGRYTKITELELVDDRGEILLQVPGLSGYVLPGATREWAYPLPAKGASATTIRMQLNGQPRTLVLGASAAD